MKKNLLALVLVLIASPLLAQTQLMSAAKLAEKKRLLPKIDDARIQKLLHDPTTVYYTLEEMPPAYQLCSASSLDAKFHDCRFNISNDVGERPATEQDRRNGIRGRPHGKGGNMATRFPWLFGIPGGTHRCEGVSNFKAIWLPKRKDGTPWPVAWYRGQAFDPNPGVSINGQNRQDVFVNVTRWVYPVGTVFFECLLMEGPDKKPYAFELRMRERTLKSWAVDAFRPYPTAEEFALAVRELRPHWLANRQLMQLVTRSSDPRPTGFAKLTDAMRDRRAINLSGPIDTLPDIGDPLLVKQLLSRPFKSALGTDWRAGAAAATTQAAFGIVPAKYDAGLVEVGDQGCMNCHRDTLVAAKVFDERIGWYGFGPGDDKIASWHPIDPATVSRNQDEIEPRIRPAYLRDGIVARYVADETRFPSTRYHALKAE